MKKMKLMQESRKNMRIDMRPRVVAKTMTKELILGSLAITCAIGK